MGNNKLKKSEILFLYETSYNIPNGDPFTGEQRYDEDTKKILVSDVRIKRFIRDYLALKDNLEIYIKQKEDSIQLENEAVEQNDESDSKDENKKASGSARRIDELTKLFKEELSQIKPKDKKIKFSEALFVMKQCVDVRLFGGISTKKTDAVNLTGPVQFALLNPSFNKVDLKIHQNTSVLESKQTNKQGAIATTTIVPYSMVQIHGWVNPKVAEKTEMTENDLKLMFEGLWYGISGEGSSHSRSKIGQNSVLLIEIIYKENNKKIYGVDKLIQIKPKNNKKEEGLRSMDDFDFDFSKLIEIASSDKVEKIRFYTEIESIKSIFSEQPKLTEQSESSVQSESPKKSKFEEIKL